jgi:signal transduction histidine kinase
MSVEEKSRQELVAEVEELRRRLAACEETLEAMRRGKPDGAAASGPQREQVCTVKSAPFEDLSEQKRDEEGLETSRKRTEQAARQSARELEVFDAIAEVLFTVRDEAMYSEVLEIILEATESKYGVFGYIEENGDLVVPSMARHIWDKCRVREKSLVFPRDAWGDCAWVQSIKEKSSICSNKPSTKIPAGHIDITRHVSAPLVHRDEIIGLLQVANKDTDYTGHDIRLLESIGRRVAPLLAARLQRDRQERHRRRAEDELVRKTRLAAIGELSATIAHDLRNPLASIQNAVFRLKCKAAENAPFLQEYLGIIGQEAARADGIINNLLSMVKANALHKREVDFGRLVADVLAKDPKGPRLRCKLSLTPDPYPVCADLDQLRRVVQNLLDNAAAAMGGQGELFVEARRDGQTDTIIFRDSGPGVPAEVRETLFEPLVTTKTAGIGLGLTICRQIVAEHGGTIELMDQAAGGAAFRIRLPRAKQQARS